jgi:hypothetical protein
MIFQYNLLWSPPPILLNTLPEKLSFRTSSAASAAALSTLVAPGTLKSEFALCNLTWVSSIVDCDAKVDTTERSRLETDPDLVIIGCTGLTASRTAN